MEKKINKLLAVTLIGALFFGGIAFLLRNSKHDTVSQGENYFDICDYIEIDLQSLDVTVIPSSDDEIRVSYKNALPLAFELGDNSLSITESKDFVVSLFAGSESEFGLYLFLPNRSYRELSITTGTGNVKIGRVDSERMNVLTETGDIVCEDMVSLSRLTTTDGYISVNFEAVMSGTEILSRRGDAEITLPDNGSTAVDFRTEEGECVTDLWAGQFYGSHVYSMNGGDKLIYATVERGSLTIK